MALLHCGFTSSRVISTLYALHYGQPAWMVGVILSTYAAIPALISIHVGKFIDKIGVRIPITVSFLMISAACLMPILFPYEQFGFWPIIVTSLLAGTGFVFTLISGQGLIGHLSNNKNRTTAFTYQSIAFSISGSTGPVVAGYLIDHGSYYWAFGGALTFALLGGGIFLLIYIILALTFGYTMIMAETSIGRMTKKSPVGAFSFFGKTAPFKIGGWLNAVIPMLIVPYYSTIGGWVIKYLVAYLSGKVQVVAEDGYFSAFISDSWQAELWFIVFAALVFIIILGGVKNGVELMSRIMMPVLVVLAIIVAIYSVTRPGAIEGVKYFLIPNFEHFSWMTVVAAMGQMFYSLSIAMGILYTYGSYISKDIDLEQFTTQIEIFDTGIAVLAGLMIIPAVFAFSGGNPETLQAGPSLMFITLPKVFASMGIGTGAGILFFVLVLLAALTSAVSLMETSVSTFMDELHWSRGKASFLMVIVMIVFGSASSLGYGVLDFIKIFGMNFLDFFDFMTNSVMMPLAALATCFLVIKVVGFDRIAKEIEQSSKFGRKKLYNFFLKYLAPICLIVILLSSIANVLGIISM